MAPLQRAQSEKGRSADRPGLPINWSGVSLVFLTPALGGTARGTPSHCMHAWMLAHTLADHASSLSSHCCLAFYTLQDSCTGTTLERHRLCCISCCNRTRTTTSRRFRHRCGGMTLSTNPCCKDCWWGVSRRAPYWARTSSSFTWQRGFPVARNCASRHSYTCWAPS